MPTLLACSGGGHLKQLTLLADSIGIRPTDRLWFTFDTALSRSILNNEETQFVPYVSPRSIRGTASLYRHAASLLRTRHIDQVVSTGAIPGLAALAASTGRGLPGHYIESAARVTSPSLSGRAVSLLPNVRLYSQYRGWPSQRWSYRGSIYDHYAPAKSLVQISAIRRAVVTVGTTEGYSFQRFYERLVPLLAGVDVLWQTGSDDVGHFGITGRPRVDHSELHHAMIEADVVIAHAGTGSALSAFEAGKRPVLVPRRKHLHEHIDDHQLQIAKELAHRGLAVTRSIDQLQYSDLIAAATSQIQSAKAPQFILN